MMRVLSSLVYAASWLATITAALWVGSELMGYPTPPPHPPSVEGRVQGRGFRVEREEQHIVHLSGAPYALGFENSRLLAPLMRQQEETLLDLLFGFAGGPISAMAIRHLSLVYLTGLDDYLTDREQLEILGLAEGTRDPLPDLGPRYARIAAYHAIHELSQRFAVDNPMACSLIAVGAADSADGHAWLARNFDFEGGDTFDLDKVVVVVRPDDGYGFVSISWAGMAGVVSGINEHGLTLTINAGASSDYRRVGAPTTLLLRRALQQTRTVDEAVRVLTAEPRFVTDIIGLADASGRVAVLELTPTRHALREGSTVAATNQLEATGLDQDPVSRARETATTTVPRRRRLAHIAGNAHRPLGRDDLLAILRDRRGEDGSDLPLGHRHALDALIATHSVIFDATTARVWVSQGPHTLGPYHGYDVAALVAAQTPDEVREAYLPSLPADPLESAYPRIRLARSALDVAEAALDRGALDVAERMLGRTAALGDHPRTLHLRGLLAHARGDTSFAREYLVEALRVPPEYPAHREALEEDLRAMGASAEAAP